MDDQSLTDAANAALATLFEGQAQYASYDDGASDTGATSEASDAGGSERPRGDDGRFVSAERQAEEPEAAEETEEIVAQEEPLTADEQQELEDMFLDPSEIGLGDLDENHVLFTKYGGDLTKALEALQEGQSTIGSMATELGELRKQTSQVETLQEQLEGLKEMLSLQQQSASTDWDDLIVTDPERAVKLAAEYQNTAMFEQALEAWASEEPLKVFLFLQEQMQQPVNEPPAPTLESEVESLKQRHPDLVQRLPLIQEEAQKRPALARLLNDADPVVRTQALEDLYSLTQSRENPVTSTAARRVVLQAKAEAERAKADAAVSSASNSNVAPPEPPKTGDEALQETLQQFLGLGDDFRVVG